MPGPKFPIVDGVAVMSSDCPATLLPNGCVLFTAASSAEDPGKIVFFEYNPRNADTKGPEITRVDWPTNGVGELADSRMLLLPTGNVLFTPSTTEIACYVPDFRTRSRMVDQRWRPTITSVTFDRTASGGDVFTLTGTQLSGLSQANTYGDDCSSATNYPVVRLTDGKRVRYARTFNVSSIGVGRGNAVMSCQFQVEKVSGGSYGLCVVANGISSLEVSFDPARLVRAQVIKRRRADRSTRRA
jgi:hypothetical protein